MKRGELGDNMETYVVTEFRILGQGTAPGMRSYGPFDPETDYSLQPEGDRVYIAVNVSHDEAQRLVTAVSARTLAFACLGLAVVRGNLRIEFIKFLGIADAMGKRKEFLKEMLEIANTTGSLELASYALQN
jgi:hypothetical protein